MRSHPPPLPAVATLHRQRIPGQEILTLGYKRTLQVDSTPRHDDECMVYGVPRAHVAAMRTHAAVAAHIMYRVVSLVRMPCAAPLRRDAGGAAAHNAHGSR